MLFFFIKTCLPFGLTMFDLTTSGWNCIILRTCLPWKPDDVIQKTLDLPKLWRHPQKLKSNTSQFKKMKTKRLSAPLECCYGSLAQSPGELWWCKRAQTLQKSWCSVHKLLLVFGTGIRPKSKCTEPGIRGGNHRTHTRCYRGRKYHHCNWSLHSCQNIES